MQQIKHVFFDLDHTLWDFEKNSALAFQKIFNEHQLIFDFNDFLQHYIPINQKYWKLYREEKVDKHTLRYSRLKESFDLINFSVHDDVINQLAIDYIESLPHFNHLFDGTKELLDYLQEKYELHIITNGFKEVQSLKLANSGIINYFNQIITSESVGVKKPNPKVFYHALESAAATSENSVMIGDNLEADIFGALDCNLSVIHCNFNNDIDIPKNITSVRNLLEIKQYI